MDNINCDSSNDKRKICKYGSLCYQKNPLHHKEYKHPFKAIKRKLDEPKHTVGKQLKLESESKVLKSDSDNIIVTTESTSSNVSSSCKNAQDISHGDFKDMHDFIKAKFLLSVPSDFYELWTFCKDLNENKPQDALKDVGLTLVGPYDVLSGKFQNADLPDDAYLRHWRYYYDPPEFQTILANINTGYHIGYFRDDPKSDEYVIACNTSKDCEIKGLGDNIFTALKVHIDNYLKTCDPFSKLKVIKLQKTLVAKQESKLACTTNLKRRERKVVTKTFHKMGLVVPFDRKTEVGYRELIESDAALKKKLKMFSDADSPKDFDNAMTLLQPIITCVTLATDECDFGTGIEFGIDLFCNGSPALHKLILSLLTTGYNLIQREDFSKIIKAHLIDRKKGSNLSVL